MKTCVKCNTEYPLSSFYKSKGGKDGHRTDCKYCCRESDNKYKEINKVRLYKQTKDWKLKNKESIKEYMIEYRITNKDKIQEVNKLWVEENRDRYRVIKNVCNAQRRATKKCAFVKWADNNKIKILYKEAQKLTLLTGIQHHVDHIIPLVNDLVCGLHCEDNLRVITALENITKGNKLIEDIV